MFGARRQRTPSVRVFTRSSVAPPAHAYVPSVSLLVPTSLPPLPLCSRVSPSRACGLLCTRSPTHMDGHARHRSQAGSTRQPWPSPCTTFPHIHTHLPQVRACASVRACMRAIAVRCARPYISEHASHLTSVWHSRAHPPPRVPFADPPPSTPPFSLSTWVGRRRRGKRVEHGHRATGSGQGKRRRPLKLRQQICPLGPGRLPPSRSHAPRGMCAGVRGCRDPRPARAPHSKRRVSACERPGARRLGPLSCCAAAVRSKAPRAGQQSQEKIKTAHQCGDGGGARNCCRCRRL